MHQLARSATLSSVKWLILSLMALWLSGCAMLQPDFEKPDVSLTSIEILPATGLEQRFRVGLRVINPNSSALPLRGMSYTLQVDGFDLAKGVAGELSSIPAYGETTLKVDVGVSLLNSLRFVQSLLSKPVSEVNYELQAKLDIGSLLPKVVVSESGTVPLMK